MPDTDGDSEEVLPALAEKHGVDAPFLRFVRWHCLPKWRREEEGEPTTFTEYAEQAPVSRRTLFNWKDREEFTAIRNELLEEWIGDAVPQVFETAKEVATQPEPGGYKDREMILNLAGMSTDNRTVRHEGEVEHTMQDARTMTTGELDRKIKAQLREKYPGKSDEEIDELASTFNSMMGASALPAEGDTSDGGAPSGKEAVVRDVDEDEWEVVHDQPNS